VSRGSVAVLAVAVALVVGACSRGSARGRTTAQPSPTKGPVSCPGGTTARGEGPPAGERAWCELPDGREHGPMRTWFPTGKKRSEGSYREGKLEGEWTSWYDDGTVRTRGRYSDGRVVGTWSEYFADGELALEVVREGEVTHHRSFHPGGKRWKQGDYVSGREHGKWSEWDQSGKLLAEIDYDMGVVRGTKVPNAGIGVPECDRYIDAYMRCIDNKVPEAARPQMREAMAQTVEAWRQAAAGPARDGLGPACIAAYDAAKQATSSMGCEW